MGLIVAVITAGFICFWQADKIVAANPISKAIIDSTHK